MQIVLYSFIFGCLGPMIGGIIGAIIPSNIKTYIFMLDLTAGIMISIVCFSLLPEAINNTNIWITFIGYIVGVFFAIIINDKVRSTVSKKNEAGILGLMIAISIAIHNLPEGLAVGTGYEASETLGYKLLLAIAMHDVPEGISIALPLRKNHKGKKKAILSALLSGVPTGIGAWIGYGLGGISPLIISISLGFAGGIMMTIVLSDILVETKKENYGKISAIANLLGIFTGAVVSYL